MIKQDDELDKLEEDIRKLKNRYDQFFAGIQKVPPMTERRNLEVFIFEMSKEKEKLRDNSRRFRFNQLLTRYNQFREMWGRKMREREEGPLEFNRRKAALEATDPPAPEAAQSKPEPRTAEPTETSNGAGAYVKVAPGNNGEEFRRLYDQIQSEHLKLGKSANVTFEQLRDMVQKQTEMVRARYKVNTVAFRVETVDGKVKLKAKPLQE